MGNMCEGRVAIVTGAGRGIGREHALMMASEGAKVVVNDVGGSRDGSGHSEGPAHDVVAEIEAMGGQAAANGDDISSWDGAGSVVKQAIDTFGGLDIVVNNAGILRDRMLVNMTEEEWDAVIKVHLKGTFGVSRFAAAYWRERSKNGETNEARIINTTSPSGIYGNAGQTNYGAAKAGIATFTVIAAMELERYGITVNAIAPTALTRMTEDLGLGGASEEQKAAMDPRWIAPLCTWLASPQSNGVTGQVFEVSGGWLAVAEGWHRGPSTQPVDDPSEVDAAIRPLLAKARPGSDMFGNENRPALEVLTRGPGHDAGIGLPAARASNAAAKKPSACSPALRSTTLPSLSTITMNGYDVSPNAFAIRWDDESTIVRTSPRPMSFTHCEGGQFSAVAFDPVGTIVSVVPGGVPPLSRR